MHDVTTLDCSRIAQDLQIRKVQVENVVQLLDEGNTIPFITRYRKERTGGLNEEVIRQVQGRIKLLRQLSDRKQTILKSIEGQGKLTAELRAAIQVAETSKRLEDLYIPYKPKKRSLATAARERGLEPLALAVWFRDSAVANLDEILPGFVNPDKELPTPAEVRTGVQHILAELISETADVRAAVRSIVWESGKICSAKHEKVADGQGLEYKDYFQFAEPLRQIPAHRILALNRGEKENALKIHLEWHGEAVIDAALKMTAEFALRTQDQAAVRSQWSVVSGPKSKAGEPQEGAGVKPEAGNRSETTTEVTPVAAADHTGASPQGVSTAQEPAVSAAAKAVAAVQAPASAAEVPLTESAAAPPVPPAAAPETSAPAEPAAASVAMPAAPAPSLPDPCPLPPDVGEPLLPASAFRSPHAAFLKTVIEDALTRLLLPSLEREIRHELTEEAEAHAVAVFARNLRSLLLQPPLRNRRVLAIDPGFRTGCKVAVLDETGNLLDDTVIYPHGKKPKERGGKHEQAHGPGAAPPADKPADPATGAVSAVAATAVAATAVAATAVASPAIVQPPVAPPAVEAAAPAASDAPAAQAANPPDNATSPGALKAVSPTVPDATTSVPATAPPEATAPVAAAPAAAEPVAAKPSKHDEARAKLAELVTKHQVSVVAIGNGTGCRETEEFVAELIATRLPDLAYVIVNEAGASVYSVSPVGREEFPTYDATLRGTISIGRRLQDPLSELVKVDPQNIGVGLYQHDVRRRDLKESLDAIVESSVNQVGVDLNTASVPLLRHISGLNQMVARELVEHRKKNGAFKNREQLLQLPGMGATRFVQAAGFLKIHSGDNPLDSTWIHPESYNLTHKILADLGYGPDVVEDKSRAEELRAKLKTLAPGELAGRLGAGVPTVADILDNLARPGRDPREDLSPPIFKKGILKLDDLQPGMELKGTVLNVVDFGAFVDIGLKDSGLVHISQMANRYIKSPYDVVAVNDVVVVWVLTVDKERHRVSLTMIKPGTERKPGEKPPRREQPQQQGSRAPRGRRPGPPPGQGQGPAPNQGQGGAPGQQRQPPRHGRHHGRGPAPAPAPVAAQETTAAPAGGKAPPPARQAPPPRPAHPPRKHRREAPKPKLSQAALEGKVPLRTFGELSALFAAKTREPAPPSPPPAAAVEAAQTQEAAAEQPANQTATQG
jgi:uncharacterized protein